MPSTFIGNKASNCGVGFNVPNDAVMIENEASQCDIGFLTQTKPEDPLVQVLYALKADASFTTEQKLHILELYQQMIRTTDTIVKKNWAQKIIDSLSVSSSLVTLFQSVPLVAKMFS